MTNSPILEPVAPELLRSLRDHVHERLRRAIVAGQFAEGEKLNERQLSEQFGVSTTPVKDAIRKLESEGLVRTEARRGVFVEFSAKQALQMALARAGLESIMTHIAANRITDEGLAELERCISEMERATRFGELEEIVALNETYHHAIHKISGCDYLATRLDGQRLYDTAQRIALLGNTEQRAQGFTEHREIFEAIAKRDAKAAEHLMRRHIVRSAQSHVRIIFGAEVEGVGYDI